MQIRIFTSLLMYPRTLFNLRVPSKLVIPKWKSCLIHVKWQCRLIFESKFWKIFKVNNHHSGVTYGCTGKYLTVEKKIFQSLPRHLADTVEDVKNQPHSRWKIVFLIIQRKWPKFKKWVWPVKIPWKLSILCL